MNNIILKDLLLTWFQYGRGLRRFLTTFIDNRRVFLNLSKPTRGPLAAVFNLSSRCDAKCSFCSYWYDIPPEKELSTDDKLKVIRSISESGVWLISFCSAEPLLVEDIDLLIKEAKQGKMLINISTNGSTLKEKAEMIVNSGVDGVTISVDSFRPEIHDELRGYPGLFSRLEDGISELSRLRKKRPSITVRCMLSAKTYFSLDDYVEYWKDKVDKIVFKPIFLSPDKIFNIPEDMKPRKEDETDFRKYFAELLKKYPFLDTEYHRLVPDHLFGAGGSSKWYCFAGSFFTDIDCEGNIHPCTEIGKVCGNILKSSFLEIWASEEMNDFRESLKSKKACSDCWGDKFASGIKVQQVLESTGGI